MLTIGTQKSDRITTITDTTWAEYINLNLPKKRVSFRNGVITIVSPGRNHELIGDYIRAIIWAYCRSQKIPLFSFNSTTLKEEGKEGKEPDVAYCFGTDKDKPDLAVEINLTSGSIDDLTKYQYLKIAEVWLWERTSAVLGVSTQLSGASPMSDSFKTQNKIRFFVYSTEGYLELTTSNSLPSLNSDRVTEIVNSCFGKSVLEVEKYFA